MYINDICYIIIDNSVDALVTFKDNKNQNKGSGNGVNLKKKRKNV